MKSTKLCTVGSACLGCILVASTGLATPIISLSSGGSISASGDTIISIGQPIIGLTAGPGGAPTANLGFVPCVVGGCLVDFNRDGVVDFFDYLDFVAAFANFETAADFNSDGVIDFFDYLDFISAFSARC